MRLMILFKPRAHTRGSSVRFHDVKKDRNALFQPVLSSHEPVCRLVASHIVCATYVGTCQDDKQGFANIQGANAKYSCFRHSVTRRKCTHTRPACSRRTYASPA